MILLNNAKLRHALLLVCSLFFLCAESYGAQHKPPVTLFEDDFDAYTNNAEMIAFWGDGSGLLETNIPGGGQAMLHRGWRLNDHGSIKRAKPDGAHNVVLSADFYDFATNTERQVAVSLTNQLGDFLAIGIVGAQPYAIRASFLPGQTNWVAIRRGQVPVPGWHHIEAILTVTNVVATLDLGAKGRLDKRLVIPITNTPSSLTEIRIGSFVPGSRGKGPVLVDNVRVQLVHASTKIGAAPARKLLSPNAEASAPVAAASGGLIAPEVLAAAQKKEDAARAPESQRAIAGARQSTDAAGSGERTQSASVLAKELELASAQLTNPSAMNNGNPRESTSGRPAAQNLRGTHNVAEDTTANAEATAAPGGIGPLWWIVGALGAIIVLLLYLVMVLRRSAWGNASAIQSSLLPVVRAGAGHPELPGSAGALAVAETDGPWRKRALEAEALVSRQAHILHEKVGPELVEFAKETLVQGLYTQRTALIETQARAQEALLELEKRLGELNLPLQERIQAYEVRITELEKQLESRNDEMRELTRATLVLIRKKVEEAKAEGTQGAEDVPEPRLN